MPKSYSFLFLILSACGGTDPGSIQLSASSTLPNSATNALAITSVAVTKGSSTNVFIGAAWSNTTENNLPDIILSSSSLPSGVTTAFDPATLVEADQSSFPIYSKLTIAANSSAPTGSSIITINATGGAKKSALIQLTLEIQ